MSMSFWLASRVGGEIWSLPDCSFMSRSFFTSLRALPSAARLRVLEPPFVPVLPFVLLACACIIYGNRTNDSLWESLNGFKKKGYTPLCPASPFQCCPLHFQCCPLHNTLPPSCAWNVGSEAWSLDIALGAERFVLVLPNATPVQCQQTLKMS